MLTINMALLQRIHKITEILFLIGLMLLPFFFLPTTREYYDTNKWVLFLCLALIALGLWVGRFLIKKEAPIVFSRTTSAIGLLAIASILSLTIQSFNKIEGLVSLYGPITWISATILLFFGSAILTTTDRVILRLGLVIGAGIAGLLVIYQQLGIATMIFPQNSPFVDPMFTPLGSPIGLIMYSIVSLPISISIAMHAIQEKKELLSAIAVVTVVLTLVGTGIMMVRYIGIFPTQTLPIITGLRLTQASWNTITHSIFGVGPEKFFEIFTLFRPQSMNMSPAWNIGFTLNASLGLHIASTFGILGFVSLILFFIGMYHQWSHHWATLVQALCIIVWFMVAPPTFLAVLIPLLFLLSDEESKTTIHMPGIFRIGVSIILCIGIACSFYGVFRWYQGERLLYKALQAAEENNGTKAFMLEEQALKTNPMNPLYHSMLSQTALLLTDGLIHAAPVDESGKPILSDEDKTLMTNLVGRSIQEAKKTITLSPTNVQSWVTLAKAYQGLLGIAKDADTWAIASYQKAMELDPTNPVLHLNLGGLYMSLNQYESAAKEFITAITLKPNYIDGYYNLANAFIQSGNWDQAVIALEQTKSLVAKNSTDAAKIEQEIITVLEEKKKKGLPQNPTSLSVPRLQIPNSTAP
jgi:hypothetical protein